MRLIRPSSASARSLVGCLKAQGFAFFGFFVTAALTLGGNFQRWNGNGFAVFDRDHGEVAAIGMAHFAGADILCFDTDADFHGSSARIVDAGVKSHQVADVYRLFKQDLIDRQGNAVVAAVTAGAGISDLVEQAQKFTAVDVAAKIGGVRHHQLGHDEFV